MSVNQKKDIATIVQDLVTTDVSGRTTIQLLSEAVSKLGDQPPCQAAARSLEASVGSDDTVVIATGFPIPPTMRQETDGPPGAISIARAVSGGFDANPIVVCDEAACDVCENAARAGELNPVDWETNIGSTNTVTIEPFPIDRNEARERADELIADLDPSVFVAVETVGSNRNGEYHNSSGYNVSDHTAKTEELIELLDERIPTIAVGDAGNEVGMGTIEETIRDRIQFGSECQCECEGGIADSTEVDILVPATVSNWGAYGIAACLSGLVNEKVLHTPEIEKRMLVHCSMAGAIDGPTEKPNAWVDSLPTETHTSIVRLLNQILRPSIHERRGEDSASVR